MDELLVERVLRAVEQVPPGRLVTYGDIGRVVGVGARQVGTIMRHWGSNVAWWRVVNASGALPSHLRDEAAALWAGEGIVAGSGQGFLERYRVDRAQLGADWARACADLEGADSAESATDPS